MRRTDGRWCIWSFGSPTSAGLDSIPRGGDFGRPSPRAATDHWHAARCGGNLASDVTLSGHRPFFFYSRPTRNICLLSLSLSLALALAPPDDPLHLEPVWQGPIDKPLGDELLLVGKQMGRS